MSETTPKTTEAATCERVGASRRCYFVPVDGYVEGRGYRVSIVTEGEYGHSPSGSWPYVGLPGQTMPYFWGHDYAKACEAGKRANLGLGLDAADVSEIICSSIVASAVDP